MSLSIGIIGLPNVGKSTLFNALLKRQAALAANYPFATIEPNIGVVDVPDARLERLAHFVRNDHGQKIGDREIPEKIIPSVVKFYDIAGLVKGASVGEGLGNQFLGHIREVDAIVQVVRDFSDENVIRAGSQDPEYDVSTINTELVLSDIQVLEKRMGVVEREAKTIKSKESEQKLSGYKKLYQVLDKGLIAAEAQLTEEEKLLVSDLNLLTLKPMIFILNTDESEIGQKSKKDHSDKIYISAKVEAELASFTEEERAAYLQDLGLSESGLDKVIRKGYDLLGLQDFLTMGPKEVRAWTIKKGTNAQKAAGKIHTDFEKGFIAADVIAFEVLDGLESLKKAKEKGLVRLEGKDYIMKDGDVVEFRINV